MLVGVISDTHGTLPDAVTEAFRGVEQIVHAGDVGSQQVLDDLEAIAPVVAVRGNMDAGELEWRLPEVAVLRCGPYRLVVGHILERLRRSEVVSGADIIVSGHTHRADVTRSAGVVFVNPGTAGQAGRDGRGRTVAVLDCAADPLAVSIIEL
jgi:putative phosphoesterase